MTSPEINKVMVVGTGGVGGFIGGRLAQASAAQNFEVYFVARGQHLEAIRKNGLRLETSENGVEICVPTAATDRVEELPVPDLVFVCVKSYDLEQVAIALNSKISEHTIVVPLLNGIDIVERLRKQLRKGVVLPACIYVGTHIERPGMVRQKGGEGRILLGTDPDLPDFDPAPLLRFFDQAGIKYRWLEEAYPAIWQKFIFIASFGLVGAASGQTIGQIMAHPESRQQVREIAKEIHQIAERKKIRLPGDIVEATLEKGHSFPYETKTSFQRDYELKATGKPNEKELFGEAILHFGQVLQIKTPHTEQAYQKLL